MKQGHFYRWLAGLLSAGLCLTTGCAAGSSGNSPTSEPTTTDIKGNTSMTAAFHTTNTTATVPHTTENVPAALEVGDPNFRPGTYYDREWPVLTFRQDNDSVTLGSWWWYLHRLVAPDDNGITVDQMLDTLIANHVTEIYLDIGAMMSWENEVEQGGLTETDDEAGMVSERYVRGFVKKCGRFGIRVAAMAGSAGDDVLGWIRPENDYRNMRNFVAKVAAYQANAEEDEKFYAVHMDVEHITESQYGQHRDESNQWFSDLVIATREECDRIGVELEWDLWAWTAETDTVTNQFGETVNLLEVMARECQALCMMAYTNTGAEQFNRGSDLELAYARKYGCRLIIAGEMTKGTPISTTYYFSPIETTIQEQNNLRQKMEESGYDRWGGAIHHVASFYYYMVQKFRES